MKYNNCVINDPYEFEEAYKLIRSLFNVNERLPELVFNKSFIHFLCEESYFALSGKFWETIQQLSQLSNDDTIIVGLLDPDPVAYFFKEFGFYNWFKFATNITPSMYEEAIHQVPKGSPADAITYNSEIIVWAPLSKKWAIWFERGYDICILGFADKNCMLPAAELQGNWGSPQEGLEQLIALNFKHQQVPQEVADVFLANYSHK